MVFRAYFRLTRPKHARHTKKGTAQVDTAFLNEIETWRNIIAGNIAVRIRETFRQLLKIAKHRNPTVRAGSKRNKRKGISLDAAGCRRYNRRWSF